MNLIPIDAGLDKAGMWHKPNGGAFRGLLFALAFEAFVGLVILVVWRVLWR